MAYGRQFQTTRSDNRLRPDYTAALNAKLRYLPERLAQQAAERKHQDTLAYQQRQFRQSERQFSDSQAMIRKQNAMREREQEAGMGLEAAKAGMGFAMKGGQNLKQRLSGADAELVKGGMGGFMMGGGGYQGPDAGGISGNAGAPRGLFSSMSAKVGEYASPLKDAASKYLGHLTMGNTIGSGLVGFGAGRLFGGKSKLKKFGVGAAAGGLMSLFSGGTGGGAKDALTGSLFGGLGGLF